MRKSVGNSTVLRKLLLVAASVSLLAQMALYIRSFRAVKRRGCSCCDARSQEYFNPQQSEAPRPQQAPTSYEEFSRYDPNVRSGKAAMEALQQQAQDNKAQTSGAQQTTSAPAESTGSEHVEHIITPGSAKAQQRQAPSQGAAASAEEAAQTDSVPQQKETHSSQSNEHNDDTAVVRFLLPDTRTVTIKRAGETVDEVQSGQSKQVPVNTGFSVQGVDGNSLSLATSGDVATKVSEQGVVMFKAKSPELVQLNFTSQSD